MELTMQQFHKAYDEVEAGKAGLLADKTRLEQQLAEALKSAQLAATAAEEQTQRMHQELTTQHATAQAGVIQQSEHAVASKDRELKMLQERCVSLSPQKVNPWEKQVCL